MVHLALALIHVLKYVLKKKVKIRKKLSQLAKKFLCSVEEDFGFSEKE